MEIVNSFGKSIIVNNQRIGYISRDGLFVSGRKFADISEEGEISFGNSMKAYVEETGEIICKGQEVGYVDLDNNFVFYTINLAK